MCNSDKVKRIFVEKRPGMDIEAGGILNDLKHNLEMCIRDRCWGSGRWRI